MGMSGALLREFPRMDAWNGCLARGVDVHDDEHVRLIEGGQELSVEMVRTGVAMGLKHRDHAPVEPRLSGSQCCADLRWMMPVVVHHQDALGLAANLKPPLHASKAGKRSLYALERHLEVQPDGDRGQRIE